MATAVSYPGVYIEEFAPPPPIQPLGTSTAAFLGVCSSGPVMTPARLNNWDAFVGLFGLHPVPGQYLWYALRGFFENGGADCYIVRVSNAALATRVLLDRSGGNSIVVSAAQAGAAGNSIQVQVASQSGVSLTAYRPAGHVAAPDATNRRLTMATLNDAATFRPTDTVSIEGDPANARAHVVSVSGPTVILDAPLNAAVANSTLRLADISNALGDRTARFTVVGGSPTYLNSGSVLDLDPQGGNPHYTGVVSGVTSESIGGQAIYRVTFASPLQNQSQAAAAPSLLGASEEFQLVVSPPNTAPAGTPNETYQFLSMSAAHPNYFAPKVNGQSQWITVAGAVPPSTAAPPNNIPAAMAAPQPLLGGADENLATLQVADYQAALATLVPLPDVNLVLAPGANGAVAAAVRDHCEGLRNRFAIIDAQVNSAPSDVILQQAGLTSQRGFASIYYPWIEVADVPPPPGSQPAGTPPPTKLVPPSGHVAGIFTRIDASRGVHKAPAGQEAAIAGAQALERVLSDRDQGDLNLNYGINVIRVFRPRGRPTVWGARTTATGINTNWQYINIRRLFLFLEASIAQGIRGSVFEPNNTELWQKLKRTITQFLTAVWRDGALFGLTAKEAFYVRIDDALNPPDQLALGRLTIEIGVRPSYPAEFIVVRIGIWQGGSQVSEQ